MLRKIVSSLHRQDWTAVAIELIVVIAGVFIGVQASNWNEQRETEQKAAVFTARLKADLRKGAWMYELETGYLSQVLVDAKRAADDLTGKASLSAEALLIAAYRATQDYPYTRYSATYDQPTSTGQMGLIRDSALRDLAMRVYTEPFLNQIGSPQQQSENQYRKAFRMVLPYEVQESLNEKCGDRVVPIGNYHGIAHMLDYPCATGLPSGAIAASIARLRSDSQLVALLQLRIANVETNRILLTTLWRGLSRALASARPGEAVNRSAELRHRNVLRAGVLWVRPCRASGIMIGRCCHD